MLPGLIRAVCTDFPRLHLERLPAYAPDLNPVEFVWSHLKDGRMANFIPRNVRHLDRVVRGHLHTLRRSSNCSGNSGKAQNFLSLPRHAAFLKINRCHVTGGCPHGEVYQAGGSIHNPRPFPTASMHANAMLTPLRRAQMIAELASTGASLRAIATRFDVCEKTVRRWRSQAQLLGSPQRLPDPSPASTHPHQ